MYRCRPTTDRHSSSASAGHGKSASSSRHESSRHGSRGHDHGSHSYSRRERIFEQGDLRHVILKLIADKPSHGYELIKDIEERLGGAYSPSPGVVYPTLTLLEDLGWVTMAQTQTAKKAYTITEEGLAALEREKAAIETIFARMGRVADRAGVGPAPQIVRAMENLKLALRLRLERGKPSDEAIAVIAAALDAAALAVEKD
ncbi:MAG: PadR family transcriptional regulator [Caulobacteraceae bacterium]|nr:PadR family transcriptional regulator [Caulobacteraceae bacterium]